MAKNRSATFAKRARERARQERRKEKAEKIAQRRAEKKTDDDDEVPAGVDPDIAHIVPGPQPLPEEAQVPEDRQD